MNTDLALVMPVYNEEDAIEYVVAKWTKELIRLGIHFQIHAYNDGSRDQTSAILHRLAIDNARLVIHDKGNSGHGPTIIQAYRENSDAPWIFQIDSDDEIGVDSFEDIWNHRNEFQFLIGKRIRARQQFSRKVISMISRISVWILYGKKVYDVNSPYRLMKGEVFKKLFPLLPDNMFAPNVVIAGVASFLDLNIYEIPVQQKQRTTGEVSIVKTRLLTAAVKSLYQTILFRFQLKKSFDSFKIPNK